MNTEPSLTQLKKFFLGLSVSIGVAVLSAGVASIPLANVDREVTGGALFAALLASSSLAVGLGWGALAFMRRGLVSATLKLAVQGVATAHAHQRQAQAQQLAVQQAQAQQLNDRRAALARWPDLLGIFDQLRQQGAAKLRYALIATASNEGYTSLPGLRVQLHGWPEREGTRRIHAPFAVAGFPLDLLHDPRVLALLNSELSAGPGWVGYGVVSVHRGVIRIGKTGTTERAVSARG